MTQTTFATTVFALLWSLVFAVALSAQNLPQVRLANDLDRPGEGYCIDILGVGPTARVDLPLVVHNCLPNLSRVDRHAVFSNGRIVFPSFDMCVTAFGVVSPLPGAAVILRPCGASESFLPADVLQRFVRTPDGQLQLAGSDLCLTAGPQAARTFSASDRWRILTMQTCASATPELSTWN